MNKCAICGKDSGKGKTCSSTCRSKLARSVATVSEPSVANATVEGATVSNATVDATVGTITPEGVKAEVPANYGKPDCACLHCRSNRANGSRHVINHGKGKTIDQLDRNEVNRVALPGDVDYGKD